MENPSFVGISRQVALRSQMDIIANNIANMNTPGYRNQNMVFAEYISKPRDAEEPLSMVNNMGHFQDTSPGPMRMTGNPLDVALKGPGYLTVETPDGPRYTRAGSMQINANGELVTSSGKPVLNNADTPIVIPEDAKAVKISKQGVIATDDGEIGQLKIAEFENVQELEQVGDGLFKSPNPPAGGEGGSTIVVQGALEGSNVNSIREMTRMIDVHRSYAATQSMVQGEHDRLRTMIRQLTRTS